MKTEILLVYIMNLVTMARILVPVSIVFIGVMWSFESDDSFSPDKEESRKTSIRLREKYLTKIICIPTVLLVIALMPNDIGDLWKTRIDLIKFELASLENVKASTEKIAEIAHKLECKYLGCEEKK